MGPPQTFGPSFPFVIVAPLTTARRGLSLHVEIEPRPQSGLESTRYVQCELIRSVNANRLIHRLGTVEAEPSAEVADVVRSLLGY